MKKILSIFALLILGALPFNSSAQDASSGDIKATVTDENGQPMPGAVVILISASGKTGNQTDMDGNATFRALTPGSYDVQTHVVGYKTFTKTAVEVNAGQTSYATFPMQLLGTDSSKEIVIRDVRSPVDPKYSSIQNMNVDQIRNTAADRTSLMSMVTGNSSQVSQGPNGGLVMRGARENASATYVDGEVMYGNIGVPAGSIEQISILSGGIPASYGDVTGGIVIVTTKSYWSGIAAKQDAIDAAAAEKAAADAAALEQSGQRHEDNNQIIENASGTTSTGTGTTTPATTTTPTDGTTAPANGTTVPSTDVQPK
ncbi:MAG TPA: carboxypeptidase regulatory-like domain-containing protein [Bacteroidia bacterium]|jgi:hypothetical protein|nr:carboxypeptidase regulatory-like domain-containing protein [Bacteroidia bacterium]